MGVDKRGGSFGGPFRVSRARASHDESVIQESIEESMLTDYWQQKDELEEKYKRLLDSLEVEEAIEIKYRTGRLMAGKSTTGAESVMELISAIKDEYYVTRSLLLKQKILEVEEAIGQFQKKLMY